MSDPTCLRLTVARGDDGQTWYFFCSEACKRAHSLAGGTPRECVTMTPPPGQVCDTCKKALDRDPSKDGARTYLLVVETTAETAALKKIIEASRLVLTQEPGAEGWDVRKERLGSRAWAGPVRREQLGQYLAEQTMREPSGQALYEVWSTAAPFGRTRYFASDAYMPSKMAFDSLPDSERPRLWQGDQLIDKRG